MGGTKGRWLGRVVSRTLLLLLVAMVAAVAGAVPGSRAEAASKKKPPGDPPGNNGTIKIEQGNPANSDLGNEPHGENCEIWVEFYGFDKDQTADITFALQPPTKPKDSEVVFRYPDDQSKPGVPISDDAAGGGPNDPEPDQTFSFKLSKALTGVEPHPQQGYHIKLSVDVREAPGASKHKVFWMAPCPPEQQPPPETEATASTLRIAKAQEGAGQGPYPFDLNCNHSPLNRTFTLKAGEKLDIANVPPGTTCVVTETDKKGAEATITEDPVTGDANDGEVTTVADKATIVTFKNKFPGNEVVAAPPDNDLRPAGSGGSPGASVGGTNTAANPGTAVLGATETAPESAATLPRTGSDPRPLAAAGLWTLAAGGLALLAGRRPRRG